MDLLGIGYTGSWTTAHMKVHALAYSLVISPFHATLIFH